MSRSFAQRSDETELMDTEPVRLEDYRACLQDLSRVNALTLTHRPILRWLDHAVRHVDPNASLTIVDVGYGYGDLLRRIHDWSQRRGRRVDLVGIDLNPMSAPIAQAATPKGVEIDYRTGDIFEYEPDRPVDMVVSSQTTHHLSDEELVQFVAWMERTSMRGWFIADLHRHAVPFHAFRALSRLAGWHRFVQHDGPVSIARSFRREDWERIVQAAGVSPDAVSIRWYVPFRLCVSRLR
ncbi:methyltransferase domain-containing protein [Microvirga pakistanensis]|uniref:methyltransferase domain-containing protein n=1 Tax=Microvirga pakistanensis TaxID=1682650 RepID=UPI00195EC3FC|nr:methyltransferase domain-containing protein [Microvirga pakistanensis]